MHFLDTHFIIAHRLLCNPEKKWTTLDFSDCHRPSVVSFFNYLIKKKILYRKNLRGRNSYSIIENPELLLNLCIKSFYNNEEKILSFVSKRSETEILDSLFNAKIEFYFGRFTGIRSELVLSTVSGISLLIPDRKFFFGDPLTEFQIDFKLLKVKFGGNVTIILPRYKKYLRKYAVSQNKIMIPADFYTYLYLSANENIMAIPQKENFEKKLGGVNGNFLAWR